MRTIKIIIPFKTVQGEEEEKQALTEAEGNEKIFICLFFQLWVFVVVSVTCLFICSEEVSLWYLLMLIPCVISFIFYCIYNKKAMKIYNREAEYLDAVSNAYRQVREIGKTNRRPDLN